MLEAVYYGRLAEDRLVELAPLVFRAATAGDDVARSVVDRQADEIVAMVTTAICACACRSWTSTPLGGGIFRTEDEQFFQRIEAGVREVAPSARFSVLTDLPVIGAAWLGLDRLLAPKASYARARRALTHGRLDTHTRAGRKRAPLMADIVLDRLQGLRRRRRRRERPVARDR